MGHQQPSGDAVKLVPVRSSPPIPIVVWKPLRHATHVVDTAYPDLRIGWPWLAVRIPSQQQVSKPWGGRPCLPQITPAAAAAAAAGILLRDR